MAKYKVLKEFEITDEESTLKGTHAVDEEVEVEEEVAAPEVENGNLEKLEE